MSQQEARTGSGQPLAIFVREFGDPELLELRAADPGSPGPGQVRVAVHTVGVGYADILVVTGEYQLKPPLPFVPGSEFSGVVEAVGEDVDPALVGQRICGATFIGAFGQTIIMPVGSIVPLPDPMSFAEGATFLTSYSTAYYALALRGKLTSGETLVVLGASGAIGHAAIQVGKVLGAFVIGSATSEAGRAAALHSGADKVIDAHSPTWRDDLKAANGGNPVDVVIDPIGGAATEPAFRSLAWNGRLLVVGFAAGSIAKLPVNLALLKGASLIGVDNRQFHEKERPRAMQARAELFRLYAAGALKPHIAEAYPLHQYVEAISKVLKGKPIGRIVINMRHDSGAPLPAKPD